MAFSGDRRSRGRGRGFQAHLSYPQNLTRNQERPERSVNHQPPPYLGQRNSYTLPIPVYNTRDWQSGYYNPSRNMPVNPSSGNTYHAPNHHPAANWNSFPCDYYNPSRNTPENPPFGNNYHGPYYPQSNRNVSTSGTFTNTPVTMNREFDNYDCSYCMPQNPPVRNTYHPQANWSSSTRGIIPNQLATVNMRAGDGNALNFICHQPTNMERYRLFQTMLRCSNEMDGQMVYLAMYILEFREPDRRLTSPLFENDPRGHAEDKLLEHLLVQLEVVHTERLKSVTVMQNASPCARCADSYTEALGNRLGQNNDVEVVLVFSSLHWLRRLSCSQQRHPHGPVSEYVHSKNREGLLKLQQMGFTIRSTRYGDWKQLCKALQIPLPEDLKSKENYRCSLRGWEDHLLRGDLNYILS